MRVYGNTIGLRSPTVSQGDTSHHLYSVESGEGPSDNFKEGMSQGDTSQIKALEQR